MSVVPRPSVDTGLRKVSTVRSVTVLSRPSSLGRAANALVDRELLLVEVVTEVVVGLAAEGLDVDVVDDLHVAALLPLGERGLLVLGHALRDLLLRRLDRGRQGVLLLGAEARPRVAADDDQVGV